jgi:hypothetical protein
MPKVACPCGYVHDLSPIPDDGWLVVRDRDYEALVEAELANAAGDGARGRRRIDLVGRLYECPECGRIMWSASGDRCTSFRVFRPERGSRA